MRGFWAVLLTVILVCGPGCSTWKSVGPPLSAASTDSTAPSRLRVVLRTGEAFVIHDPRIAADSLFGMRELHSSGNHQESSRESCSIAIKDVSAIEERRVDVALTGLLLMPVALAIWFFTTVSSDGF